MKKRCLKALPALLWIALANAQMPTELKARLTAPLSTKFNRAGDLVVAKILQPADLAGGYLQGEVREIHAGTPTRKATVDFQFHSMVVKGKSSPVSVRVVHIVNSRHQDDMDEDGTALEQEKASSGGGGVGLGSITHLGSGLKSHIPGMGGGEKTEKAEKPEKFAGPAGAPTRLSAKANNLSLASGTELTVQSMSSK